MDDISLFNDMEAIYNFGVSVNWDIKQLLEYCRLHGYSYEIFTKLVLSYVENKGDYKEYKNLVDLFNSQNIMRIGRDTGNFNPVLFRKGIKTRKLWLDDEQKEIVLKYIYDTWKNTNLSKIKIGEMFHIDNQKLNQMLFMYAHDYLKISFEEWKEIDKKIMASKHMDYSRGKASLVLEKLLNLTSVDEIIDVINSSGLSIDYLCKSIHDYLVVHASGNYDKCKAVLDNAFDLYKEYKNKERREKRAADKEKMWQKYVKETLPNANKLVEDFINSNYDNVQNYIDANEIDLDGKLDGVLIFNKCLELVKEHNEELYAKYREKIDGKRGQVYAVIVENIKKILKLLKDGVVENDVKRPFDLIDYYHITKLSFDSILKVAKNLSKQKRIEVKDYCILENFIKINKNGEKIVYSDVQRILNEKQEINCEKNNKGYPIPGTGEIVDEEIKNKLIGYLKRINVPVNYRTYQIIFNRYKNGLIDLNDTKKYK